MITPFIVEMLGAIHIALKSVNLISSQVDDILLMGGATRARLVHRRLTEVFGTIRFGIRSACSGHAAIARTPLPHLAKPLDGPPLSRHDPLCVEPMKELP
jgi:hypothetical protein